MQNPQLQELYHSLQAENSPIHQALLVTSRGEVLLRASWDELQRTGITETFLELASSPIRVNVSHTLSTIAEN